MLDDAREAISGGGPVGHRFGGMLETARNTLDRAWGLYRNGQYRAALKLVNQVEETLRKIIASARRDYQHEGQFERMTEFVRKGLDRVQGMLSGCDSEIARQLLDRAREAFRQATDLHAQGKPRMALRALQNARKLGEQAARECRGGHTLNSRYERLLSETDRLAEEVPTADDAGRRLIQMVYDQLKMAAEHLEAGKTASAAASLKAAELTLGQLRRHLADGDG
jgi:tetratricopeptide (TPR) repeat protein